MALATRCPHCHTTFRVAQDQLKLRAGLVRCGACKQIFNGVENLLQSELPAATSEPAAAPASSAASLPADFPPPDATENANSAADMPAPATDSPNIDTGKSSASPVASPYPSSAASNADASGPDTESPDMATERASDEQRMAADMHSPIAPEVPPAPVRDADIPSPSPQQEEARIDDPMLRMTLLDFTSVDDEASQAASPKDAATVGAAPAFVPTQIAPAPADDSGDELGRTIDELQRKPWRKPKKKRKHADRESEAEADLAIDDDASEPGFVRAARRKQRFGRAWRIGAGAGSFVLFALLLGQAAYAFRDQIAARLPQARPLLEEACTHFGCRVGLPARIDLVSLESSELQAVANTQDTFMLSALLRNRGTTVQSWPNLELTLTDAEDRPVARRVFLPRDYLSAAQEASRGFSANTEFPVRLTFTTSQLKASGYRVYLFYP